MSADLRLDLSSPTPPFEQIRSRIAALVRSGELKPGARLPTVRSLAADLGVAGGTVARAYRELEAAGMVESHGRRGTAVRALPADATGCQAVTARSQAADSPDGTLSLPEPGPSEELAEAVRRVVGAARRAGTPPEDLILLIRRAAATPESRG